MLGGRNIFNDPYEDKVEEFFAAIPFFMIFGIVWIFDKLGLLNNK